MLSFWGIWWMKMKSTNEMGTHSTSARRQDHDQIKKLKDRVLLSALPLETRMEEARKPLYLSRYE
jgi:hypothetical protein